MAVTGGTGFIGRAVLQQLSEHGHRVRALARQPGRLPDLSGLEACAGTLEDAAALRRLVERADVVIHLAGAIRALDAQGFIRANVQGTVRLAEAARAAGVRRLILVSSLAAREPEVSAYGRSKALAESEAKRLFENAELVILRPPAVYGPGDRGTLPIFEQLARGWLVAPRLPRSRFSLVHVDDLARLVALAIDAGFADVPVLEPDDLVPDAYDWAMLASIASVHLGRRVRLVRLPRPVLDLPIGVIETIFRTMGRLAPVSRDKIAELFHHDWTTDRSTMAQLPDWRPRIDFERGFPATLAWYRDAGWIS